MEIQTTPKSQKKRSPSSIETTEHAAKKPRMAESVPKVYQLFTIYFKESPPVYVYCDAGLESLSRVLKLREQAEQYDLQALHLLKGSSHRSDLSIAFAEIMIEYPNVLAEIPIPEMDVQISDTSNIHDYLQKLLQIIPKDEMDQWTGTDNREFKQPDGVTFNVEVWCDYE